MFLSCRLIKVCQSWIAVVQNLITDTYLQGPAQMKDRCVFFLSMLVIQFLIMWMKGIFVKRDRIYFNDF